MSRDILTVNRQNSETYLRLLNEHDLELFLEYMRLCGNCGDIRHLFGFPSDFPHEQMPPLYSYETALARKIRERWRTSPMSDLNLPDWVLKRFPPNFRIYRNQGRLFTVCFAYWIGLPKEQIERLADKKECRHPLRLLRYYLNLLESKDGKELRKCPYSGECVYSADTYFVYKPPDFEERKAHFVNGQLVINETGEIMDFI